MVNSLNRIEITLRPNERLGASLAQETLHLVVDPAIPASQTLFLRYYTVPDFYDLRVHYQDKVFALPSLFLTLSNRQTVVAVEEGQPPPERITAIGYQKVYFMTNFLTQIKPEDRVLDLWSGTGMVTAYLAMYNVKKLMALDLLNGPAPGFNWNYVPAKNFPPLMQPLELLPPEIRLNYTQPEFVAADAAHMPLEDGSFDLIVAPDSPKQALHNIEKGSGGEWGLSYEESHELFYKSTQECFRILAPGGRLVTSAPTSWTTNLKELGFSQQRVVGVRKFKSHQKLRQLFPYVSPQNTEAMCFAGNVQDPSLYLLLVK